MNITEGQIFGRLTIVHVGGPRGGQITARCACGAVRTWKRAHITSGNTKSCGCLNADTRRNKHTKHGAVRHIGGKRLATPEYRAWQAMRNRCLNPHSADYKYYGGRGIGVSAEWGDFTVFLQDMGVRPSLQHSLDRIDGNADYCKTNCRWATRKEQARNRAYARTKAWELAEKMGVKVMTAHHYIWRVRAMKRGTIPPALRLSEEKQSIVVNHMERHGL